MIELSLAEMMNEYVINHEGILAVMRPSGTANEVQLYHKIPLEGMSVLAIFGSFGDVRRPFNSDLSLWVLMVNRNCPTDEFTMSLHLHYFRKPEVLTTYFYSIAQEARCNTLVFFQILALTASNL